MNMMELFYEGTVDLQLKIGGKFYSVKSHNEGLPYLKYLFAKFLAGIQSDIVPSYIDLIVYSDDESPDDENAGKSFLKEKIKASGKTFSDARGYYTEFKASLSSGNLSETVNVDDKRKFYIYLLSNEDTTTLKQYKLARIPMSVGLLAKITPGTTGAIVWRMRLLNGEEAQKESENRGE